MTKQQKEMLDSNRKEYQLRSRKDAEMLDKYWRMPTGQWPPELFWYVQGYCGAIGGCGEAVITGIAAWLRRKPKNKFDYRIPKENL